MQLTGRATLPPRGILSLQRGLQLILGRAPEGQEMTMKPCTMLALCFLVVGILPSGRAQDQEAEKLFRDVEKKIKGAKALEIALSYQINGKTAKGSLLLTKDDKARLRVNGHYYPGV